MNNLEIKKEIFGQEENWTTYKNTILLDGQEVGRAYTMIDSENDENTYVEDLEVYEEFRNKGIGTAVLEELAREVWGYIYLAPTDENNQRLYARLGEELIEDASEVDQGFGVYYIEK